MKAVDQRVGSWILQHAHALGGTREQVLTHDLDHEQLVEAGRPRHQREVDVRHPALAERGDGLRQPARVAHQDHPGAALAFDGHMHLARGREHGPYDRSLDVQVSRLRKLLETAKFPGAKEIVTIDGLRIEYEDGFGLIRASNTTPVLVLRFEGHTPEALHRIEGEMLALLRAVKPDAAIGEASH